MTIYRVIKDTIEITANSRFGDGRLVGKPFPRNLTPDEVENIYFANDPNGIIEGDFDNLDDAINLAKEIGTEVSLMLWNVPFIAFGVTRVEEVEINDEDETEMYTGNCWYFGCEGYESSKGE